MREKRKKRKTSEAYEQTPCRKKSSGMKESTRKKEVRNFSLI